MKKNKMTKPKNKKRDDESTGLVMHDKKQKNNKKRKELPKGSSRNAGWLTALLCLLLPCFASSFEVTTSPSCSPTGCFHSPLINRTVCDCHLLTLLLWQCDPKSSALCSRPGRCSCLSMTRGCSSCSFPLALQNSGLGLIRGSSRGLGF